jgi:DNA repair exonuclease SbcCD ATPase subunit
LELNFSTGLAAIRGANEQGKSTVFDAIAYAWWGSRALPLSLDECVTWGKATNTLKVELTFRHDGVEYLIKRSKSGAELTGGGVTASGQAEVTAFVERLFGAPAAICQATILTRQKALQDGLDSSAMSLIEKLANMQLIEELIGKIQNQKPSGNTKTLEAQLQELAGRQLPVLDLVPLQVELAQAQAAVSVQTAYVANLEKVYEDLKPQVLRAKHKQQENLKVEAARSTLQKQKAAAEKSLVVPDVVIPDIPWLESKMVEATEQREVHSHWAAFSKLALLNSAGQEPQTKEQVSESLVKLKPTVAQQQKALQALRSELVKQTTLLITETACGLCGKDLQNVPEVVEKNAKIEAICVDLREQIKQKEYDLESVERHTASLSTALAEANLLEARLQNLKHVTVDRSMTPPTVTWSGPEVQQPDPRDYAAELTAAQRLQKQHATALAAAEASKQSLESLEQQLAALQTEQLTGEEEFALAAIGAAEADVRKAESVYKDLQQAVSNVTARITTAEAVHESRMLAWQQAQQQKAGVEQSIIDYQFHNGIISKLRDARPHVAKKLWALVLAGVSHYFSAIRGTASVVTRSESGFLIDGKSSAAYSGSTTDCLSMANRIMLQKTFLPGVSVMLIDEPGAAFDDIRESDLLGVLASCGLEQVILVTHSELADSFASQVIQL